MKLATGIDLLEIERLRGAIETHGEKFLRRIFTARELDADQDKLASLAGRFAAKEAAAKALGCGIGDVGWLDIEVRSDERKAPYLVLHGEGERMAKELGLTTWSLSLSHTGGQAVAFVVAAGFSTTDERR